MPDHPITGGCLCGAVRYRAAAFDGESSTCHCRMCQRQSGAPYMAFVNVLRDDFALSGELRRYRSSAMARRGFCPACGSAVTFEYDHEPRRIGITLSSLDDPEATPPTMHWGVESQLSWVRLDDALPRRTTDEDEEFAAARRAAGDG